MPNRSFKLLVVSEEAVLTQAEIVLVVDGDAFQFASSEGLTRVVKDSVGGLIRSPTTVSGRAAELHEALKPVKALAERWAQEDQN